MKKIIITILILLGHYITIGQDSSSIKRWSLQDCISYALEHNISLQMKELDKEKALKILLSSKLDFIPSLNISMENNMNWGRSVDLQTLEIVKNNLTLNSGIGIGASIYLLDGFSKIYDYKINHLGVDVERLAKEVLEEEITLSVMKSYLQILLYGEIIRSLQENLIQLEISKKIIGELIKNNRLSSSALTEIQAEETSLLKEVAASRNMYNKELIALRHLINIEETKFQIDEQINFSESEIISLDDCQQMSSLAKSHPKIISLEKMIMIQQYNIKKAIGMITPKIGLSASYATFFSSTATDIYGNIPPYLIQLKENINPSIGISLTIPIFNNGKYSRELKIKKIDKRKQELQLIQEQKLIEQQLENLLLDTKKYNSEMKNAKVHLSYMEEILEIATLKLETGRTDTNHYTEILRRKIQSQSEYLRSKYQYLFHVEIVRFYQNFSLNRGN